jgi:ribonuclease HI
VDELINPVDGAWDEDLIRQVFWEVDSERILRIPLSDNLGDDFIAWHKTKSFNFSVRSAYYSEWEHQFGSRTRRLDGLGQLSDNPVWEKLWKMQVPSKVKKIIWRALHGVVPGKAILADRHIKVSPQCPVCKAGAENIKHMLFTCNRAEEVWKAMGLLDYIKQTSLGERSGSSILEDLIRDYQNKTQVLGLLNMVESIAVTCWYIWWQRRELVNGKSVTSPTSTGFAIAALTANFVLASSVKTTVKETRWKKPGIGFYKLNTDASYHDNGEGSVGMVLRNDRGEALAGYGCPISNVISAAAAEAQTVQQGLLFLEKLGVENVVLESDSLEIIQACRSETEVRSPYSAILADCFMHAQDFKSLSFDHCPREANMVAHHIAQVAYEGNSSFAWDGDPPDFIRSLVLNDNCFEQCNYFVRGGKFQMHYFPSRVPQGTRRFLVRRLADRIYIYV